MAGAENAESPTRYSGFRTTHNSDSVLKQFGSSPGKATAAQAQEIYLQHRRTAECLDSPEQMAELTPKVLEQKMKHLANLHTRHVLTDKGSTLLRDMAGRYGQMKTQWMQSVEENKHLHEKLKEFVILRSQLNERDAEIAVLKPGKTIAENRAQELEEEMVKLRAEMGSERSLMQKMLDELKQQFDLTVQRELTATQEAASLRDDVSAVKAQLAAQEAGFKEQLGNLRAQLAAAVAKAEEADKLRKQADYDLAVYVQESQLERAALESRVLSLEGALVASQDRERDTANKLDQALTEARGIREELIQAQAKLKERSSQLEGAQDREDYAVATVRDMEEELHVLFDRWWEENRESRDREQVLTQEQYQAKITLAETVGSNNGHAMVHNSHMLMHPPGFRGPHMPMHHLPPRAYAMVSPPPKIIMTSRDDMLKATANDLRARSQALSSAPRSVSPNRSVSPGRDRHMLPTGGRFDVSEEAKRLSAEQQERSNFRARYPATSGFLNC